MLIENRNMAERIRESTQHILLKADLLYVHLDLQFS